MEIKDATIYTERLGRERRLELENRLLKDRLKDIRCKLSVCKCYHCKKRNNTTIVFEDGHSVTVHKRAGEKDCLETAIAYALAKNIYSINKISKDTEEK